jgi:hypothetical protein
MDVKYHWIARSPTPGRESPMEAAQWVALLRLCCAMEPFFKQQRALATGPAVVQFLLQDAFFPRSVLHCYSHLEGYLARIDANTRRTTPNKARILANAMVERLSKADVDDILRQGLHDEVTHIIDSTAELNTCLQQEFFDPPMRPAQSQSQSQSSSAASSQSQSQSSSAASSQSQSQSSSASSSQSQSSSASPAPQGTAKPQSQTQ